MSNQTALNGVNLDAFAAIGEAGRADRSATRFMFSVSGTWDGGTQMTSTTGPAVMAGTADPDRAGRFTMVSDEPAPLGRDQGPSPVEYILQGLAACYTVTLAARAAQQNIPLESYTVDVEGDIDLASFVDVDPDTRPGVSQIRANFTIVAPEATREQLDQLIKDVERSSSIRDTLANPVEIITTLS